MSIDTRYFDIIQQVRALISTAGVDLTDERIYEACVKWERSVYGREDWLNNGDSLAMLVKRTDTIFTANARPWVGRAAIDETTQSDTTPTFEDSDGTAIIPATQDVQRGKWTFTDEQTRVYITGTWVDVPGAAVACFDYILAGAVDDVNFSTEGGNTSLTDRYKNIERQRMRLAGEISLVV
jgi:hypothetical protein